MGVGAIGDDGVMMPIITNNHEVWATCPVCGQDYDRRVWGNECPECARRKRKNARNNAENGLKRNN